MELDFVVRTEHGAFYASADTVDPAEMVSLALPRHEWERRGRPSRIRLTIEEVTV